MKKLVSIVFLFFTFNVVSGCDVYQKVKNKTLNLVGLADTEKKETKNKKVTKTPIKETPPEVAAEEDDTLAAEEPLDPVLPAEKKVVVDTTPAPGLSPEESILPVANQALSINGADSSEKNIAISKHVAGTPDVVFAQDNLLFVGSDHKLEVYDQDFNFKSSILLDGKPLSLVSLPSGLLCVSLHNQSLQILSRSGDGLFQSVKSFDVAGSHRLQMVDGKAMLIVFFPDRVQLLDLTQGGNAEIPVVLEWPEKVDDAYQTANNLYLSSGGSLKIIRLADSSVLSKYAVGASFKIAGVEQDSLILLPIDSKTEKTSVLQVLTLNSTGGISKAGAALNLPATLKQVVGFYDNKIFYTDETNNLHVHHFIDNRSEDALLPQLPSGSFAVDKINLLGVFPGEYARYEMEASPTPNPSVGLVKPQTKLYSKAKTFNFPQTIDSVLLLSADKLALVSSQFYLLPNGLSGAPVYTPIQSGAFKPKLIHLTANGYLFFDELTGKLGTVKMDFSGLIFFDMASQNIRGFDTARHPTGDRLVYSVAAKDGRGENTLFWARLDNGKTVRSEAKLKISEAGGLRLYSGGTRAVMAAGSEGVLSYELVEKPKAVRKLHSIVSRIPGARAIDVLVDLNEKWALVYHESANGNFISVVNLGDSFTEGAIIGDLTLSARQFAGASFADGGKTVIFPHDSGVAFYNFSNPLKPQKTLNWTTGPAYFVDVTNRSKTVCAALGSQGLVCGDR